MMKLLQTVILLSWAASKECNAFVPSVLVPRRDLLQTYLSNNNNHASTTKSEVKVKHCIPLQEIGLDDLPKVGGKSHSRFMLHSYNASLHSTTHNNTLCIRKNGLFRRDDSKSYPAWRLGTRRIWSVIHRI